MLLRNYILDTSEERLVVHIHLKHTFRLKIEQYVQQYQGFKKTD